MRNKRILLLSLCLLSLAIFTSFTYNHKQEVKPYKIGILQASDLRISKIDGFMKGMEERGYIQGKTVNYFIRNSQESSEALAILAKELSDVELDLVIATGEAELNALKRHFKNPNVPIVFMGASISFDEELMDSSSFHNSKITGIDNCYIQLSGKRLEIFKRLIPEINHMAVIYNKSRTTVSSSIEHMNEVAQHLDVNLTYFPVSTKEEVTKAFKSLDENVYDGVLLMCSMMVVSATDELYEAFLTKKLPIMGVNSLQAAKGLLVSYDADATDLGYQGARMAAKILQGYDPAKMPIETPCRVQLSVNLKTASQLGLTMEPATLKSVNHFYGVWEDEAP